MVSSHHNKRDQKMAPHQTSTREGEPQREAMSRWHPWTMKFYDVDLEAQYLHRRITRRSRRQTANGYVYALAIWVFAFTSEALSLPALWKPLAVLHLLFPAVFLLASAALQFREPFATSWWPEMEAVTSFLPGFTCVILQWLLGPAYAVTGSFVLCIYLMMVHAFMRLTSMKAVYVTLLLWLAWCAVVWPLPLGEFAQAALWTLGGILCGVRVSRSEERYRRRDFVSQRLLLAEQEKSERLLLNMLPAAIANQLKESTDVIADRFPSVSIMFADIVGFTGLSQRMDPHDLVHILNRVFSKLDELADLHGLEKIKTIGDAYMVAGGIPSPRADHAHAVAEMALAVREVMAQFPDAAGLRMRIGIHCGEAVAGVIGKRKFAYDLWGDAVNTASRMESHGAPGAIHVSEEMFAQLKDAYVLEERGVIDVKGKGQMRTYWLTAKRVVPT